MSTYATTDDVAALYEGTLPARAQALLDRAERELIRLVPGLADRAALDPDDDGYLDPVAVKDVLVDAVIRVLRNPRGLISEQDGEYAYRYGSDAAGAGQVYFTDAELLLLRGVPAGTRWSPVGTITLAPGMGAPDYPRSLRTDPGAWTGDDPAGVRPPLELREVP